MNNEGVINRICIYCLILLLSLVEFKIMLKIHLVHIGNLAELNYGVLVGKPMCSFFQSRLMGPYLIELISKALKINYALSYIFFLFIMTFIENITLLILLFKRNLSYDKIFLCIVFSAFLFVACQDFYLYSWDLIGFVVFTVFLYFVFEGKSLVHFILLFVAALLNREDAIFIALYLVVDSFVIDVQKMKIHLIAISKFLTGSVLGIIGVIYVKYTRFFLLDNPDLNYGDTNYNQYLGNQFNFFRNVKEMFIVNMGSLKIINSLIFFFILTFFIYFMLMEKGRYFKISFIGFLIVVNIFLFGLINEIRVYIVLIPFIVWLLAENGKCAGKTVE